MILNASPSATLHWKTGLDHTLNAEEAWGFPHDRLIIKLTEVELMGDHISFGRMAEQYLATGERFVIDDFGPGYAGLNLLANFVPDFLKIERCTPRGIDHHRTRQLIVRAILRVYQEMGILAVADGIGTVEEYQWYQAEGPHLFQGFSSGTRRIRVAGTAHYPDGALGVRTPIDRRRSETPQPILRHRQARTGGRCNHSKHCGTDQLNNM